MRRRQQHVGGAPIGIYLETLLSRFRGRLMIATLELAERDREIRAEVVWVERTQTERAVGPFNGAVRIAGLGHHDAAETIDRRARRAERQRRFEGSAGGGAIVRDQSHHKASERQSGGVVPPVRDGCMGMFHRAQPVFLPRAAALKQDLVTPSGEAVRRRVVGLDAEGCFEQRQRLSGAVRHGGIDVGQGAE